MNPRPPEIPPHKLITALRGYSLLPAIIFLPTRRKCDEAASEVGGDRSQKVDKERLDRRRELFDEFAAENPEVLKHKHARLIVNAGIASHHAGHIPPWKLLIEKMMSAGLLDAIFATSTVAAGVDFPARTVVVSNADTRGNDGWRPLSASELQQMTGRAGRRGKDNVGFVVLAPGQFQNPKKIAELLKAKPDPLESRFRATYTTLLNLLDAFGDFAHIREIAAKSYAHRSTAREIGRLKRMIEDRTNSLASKLAGTGLTPDDARAYERLTNARMRLSETGAAGRSAMHAEWLKTVVVPGRVVKQRGGGKRMFLVVGVGRGRVSAMRDDGRGVEFDLNNVTRVYKDIYKISDNSFERAFLDVQSNENKLISEPSFQSKDAGDIPAAELLESVIAKLLPTTNVETERTHLIGILSDSYQIAAELEKAERDIEHLTSNIWIPFERRARVLDHFGYLELKSEKTTESGRWLADVRVDRPLLVGESLRRGLFDDLEPRTAAGLMAALAADPDRSYGDLYLSDPLLDVISRLEDIIYDVSNVEWSAGIEPLEEINLSAAATAERWAGGMSWDDLVARTKAEEGDLFRLLARTGEALTQIAYLKDSNQKAAVIARVTAEAMLRDPIR